MEFENIEFEIQDSVSFLTFNRPKALNALNQSLLKEVNKVLDIVYSDESIRVLVLTGSGDKAFVAGADISELKDFTPLEAKVFADLGQGVMDKLQTLPVPVIAAVNGFALGGGSEMALACDFIYASENAIFGLPELTLGLIPGFGGTQRLPRLVGKNIAKELIFTGKRIKAQKAEELGIVNKVVAIEDLYPEVLRDIYLQNHLFLPLSTVRPGVLSY